MTIMVRVRCDRCGFVTSDVEGATTYKVRSALTEVKGWECSLVPEGEDSCYGCSSASDKAVQADALGGSPHGRFQIFAGVGRRFRRIGEMLRWRG